MSRGSVLGLLVALFAVALNDAYVVADRGFLHPPERLFSAFSNPTVGDHFRYRDMALPAEARSERDWARQAPWRYRILTPAVVRALGAAGMNRDAAFYLVSQLGLVGFLTLLFGLLRARGFDDSLALTGTLLVGLVPGAVRWYAFQYWMADPLALCAVTGGLLLIERGRVSWLLLLAPIAAANRENILLVFPYLFVSTWQRDGARQAVVQTAPPLAAACAVLAGLRIAIDAIPAPDLWTTVTTTVGLRFANLGDQLYFATLGSFGVFAVLPFIGGRRRSWRGALPDLAVLAVAYASLLVATNSDRLLAYALPCLAPIALGSVRSFLQETHFPLWSFAVATGCVQAILYLQTDLEWTDLQLFDPIVTAALGALLLVCFGLRRMTSG